MKSQFTKCGYNITTKPGFQNDLWGISLELSEQLQIVFFEAQDEKNKKVIEKLENLIIQYPKSPQLKNYLSIAYKARGKHDKALEINDWALAEHPDYLFAKINKAHQYILDGEPENVPSILGQGMEIKELYPNRDLFHLDEITAFYRVVIYYYIAIDNWELAESKLKMLKKIDFNNHNTEAAETHLVLKKVGHDWNQLGKTASDKTFKDDGKSMYKDTAPNFNHPEINDLYRFGLTIPHNKLEEILGLPRQSLVEDLENILVDAIERYDYFSDMECAEETHNFVLHALFLLKEIDSKESWEKIISFLDRDEDFLEFWLGDHRVETIWQCFYRLCFNNTQPIKQLLLRDNYDTYIQTAGSEALCQILLHNPERKEEILNIFKDVFTFYLELNPRDIDKEFLGFTIDNCINSNLIELLPLIKQLYEKDYVELYINGDYEEVVKLFKESDGDKAKKEVQNIFDLYDDIVNSWDGYKEDDEDWNEYEEVEDKPWARGGFEERLPNRSYISSDVIQQQVISETKIGRNEACPCGSGKKYKKCCINNP